MFGLPSLSMFSVADGTGTRPNNSQEDMSALTKAYAAAHTKRPASVGPANYSQAQADLQLTPQERALYERHLTNLNGPGGVDNADGSRSTLYQAVHQHDGKFYSIPTVWNGKRETQPYTKPDGTVMDVPNQTALDNVGKAGWNNFPAYNTPDEADARYEQMHKYIDKDTTEHMDNKGRYANARVARGWDAFGPDASPTVSQPMLPTPPTPAPVDMGPPPALSAQALAASPVSTPTQPASVPMPQARPAEAPAAAPDMGFFQRNAAMMRDPSSGQFIDPVSAERANASGPDVIQKLLDMFHKKDT